MRSLRGAWDRCFEREPGLFAAGLRVGTVVVALWLSLEVDLRWAHLPRGEVMSVAGLVAPTGWWGSQVPLATSRALLWGGAVAWLFGHVTKVRLGGAWACALGFWMLGSLYWENLPWLRHKFVPPLWLLALLVAAEHARKAGPAAVAPRWVREGAVFIVATFYAGAGVHKLLASGLRWGDGTALQLWLWRLGDADSVVRGWVVADARVAAALASAVLGLELAAALAVPWPRLRPWLAGGLIALHVGIDVTLHIDFRAMIVVVALVLLPWPEWWSRLAHDRGGGCAGGRG